MQQKKKSLCVTEHYESNSVQIYQQKYVTSVFNCTRTSQRYQSLNFLHCAYHLHGSTIICRCRYWNLWYTSSGGLAINQAVLKEMLKTEVNRFG